MGNPLRGEIRIQETRKIDAIRDASGQVVDLVPVPNSYRGTIHLKLSTGDILDFEIGSDVPVSE